MIKGRKYFEGFLRKYERMPTTDELILFYYNRYVAADKKDTLPFMIKLWAEQFVEDYSAILNENKLTVDEAIKLLDKSMGRQKRKIIENS